MNLQMLKKSMLAYVSAVKFVWSSIAYPLSIVGKKFMNLRGYRVYGNSVQDGTPSPENPVEIENVGDLSTKNLLPYPYYYTTRTIYGITFTDNGDGTITLNGSSAFSSTTSVSDFVLLNRSEFKAGTYTISGCPAGGSLYKYRILVRVNDSDGNSKYYNDFGTSNNGTSFTVGDNCAVSIFIRIGGEIGTVENLVFKPQLEEGSTATDYEPYHKYKIPVVARGRNLIPMFTFKTFTTNGVTFTNNNDGTITLNGTPTGYAVTPVMSLPESSLEVLRNNVCVLTGFYKCSSGNIVTGLDVYLGSTLVKQFSLNKYTTANYTKIDLRSIKFDSIRVYVKRESDNVLIDNVTVKPFLEVGTTMPTNFEPYIEPVTTNIFLDEPLRKVRGYADYVDFEKQKAVRNISKYIFTGDENISIRIGEDRAVFYFPQILNKYGNNNKNFIPHGELCNRYQHVENVSTLTPLKISLSDCIYICDYYLTAEEYQAQLKNWYSSESPLIMYYALATPTEETVKLPALPQFKGTTIYEVGTNIKPSGIEAKYC